MRLRKRTYIGFVATMLMATFAIAACLSMFLPVGPIDPKTPIGEIGVQGWIDDPRAVNAANVQAFSATPAGMAILEDTDDVYLWDFHTKVTGAPPQPHDQADVGSCVSFGFARAIERTLAAEIALGVNTGGYVDVVEEVIYGGSRVEIGGGRLRGDGSIGAWAAKFIVKYGVIPRGQHGTYNLSRYSTAICRDFGRNGVPDALEDVARQYPIKDAANVVTWSEAKRALKQGYAIAICSNQGFTRQRDANGICRASGSWAHCMVLDGMHKDAATGREYGHIENSWGNSFHTGPVGWGNPNIGGFWCESTTINRMLSQGDSHAVSGVTGFPVRKINWFARNKVRDVSRLAALFAHPKFARAPDNFQVAFPLLALAH